MEESTTGYEPIKEFSDRQPKYEDVDRKQTRKAIDEAIQRLRKDVRPRELKK